MRASPVVKSPLHEECFGAQEQPTDTLSGGRQTEDFLPNLPFFKKSKLKMGQVSFWLLHKN